MALSADNVRVGVTGAVYVAPSGTTLPVTADNVLNVAFDDLGYISEDGVTENQETDVTDIRAWQNGTVVRKVQTSHDLTYSLTFIETKTEVLEQFYGPLTGGVVHVTADQLDRQAWVLDVVDGDHDIRVVIPDGQITERGEVTYATSEAIAYPVTITCYPDDTDVKAYIYRDSDGS